MTYRHALWIRALTRVLLLLRVIAEYLPDRAWVLALRLTACLPLPADLRSVLREAAAILEDGGSGPTLLRRLVAGTTREELEDMLWGQLVFDERGVP